MEKIKENPSRVADEIDILLEKGKALGGLLLYSLCGFVLTGARVFGVFVPFSASLAAASSGGCSLFAAAGVIFGCLLRFNGAQLVRNLAVCLGAAAAAYLTERAAAQGRKKLLLCLTVAACSLVSGSAVLLAGVPSVRGFMTCVCESALCGGMTAVYMRALAPFSGEKGFAPPDRRTLICVIVSLCSLFASIADISVANVHPARIAGAFAVLTAAYIFAEPGGSISGICVGAAAADGAFSGITSVCFAVSGLAAGIFASYGQLAAAGAFSLAAGAAAIIDGTSAGISLLAEAAVAAIVFVCIPKSALERAKERLFIPEAKRIQSGLLEAPGRLLRASEAIGSVSKCIKAVSDGIEAISPAHDDMLRLRVSERVCAGCPYEAEGCPENGEFTKTVELLRAGGVASVESLGESFAVKCPSAFRVAEAFNRVFQGRTAASAVEINNARARDIACKQFDSVSALLSELSQSICSEASVLYQKEKTASRVFEENGLTVSDIHCVMPQSGATALTARVASLAPGLSISTLTRQLSRELNTSFLPPHVEKLEDCALLTFERKELLAVRFGAAGSACGDERLCGDYYECFRTDSKAYILLSDGMGTGGRAAVDSAMTVELFSRLLRSGISIKTALEITNCALTVKSKDESLSTLDIAEIDLFTGETVISKAGAAASFCKIGNKVKAFETPCAPLGILSTAQLARSRATLTGGDVLLLVSDGVLGCGNGWITDELGLFDGISASDFAAHILETAKRKCGKRFDDMTVIAAVVENL